MLPPLSLPQTTVGAFFYTITVNAQLEVCWEQNFFIP